jgi:hypothetical protein
MLWASSPLLASSCAVGPLGMQQQQDQSWLWQFAQVTGVKRQLHGIQFAEHHPRWTSYVSVISMQLCSAAAWLNHHTRLTACMLAALLSTPSTLTWAVLSYRCCFVSAASTW